MRAAVLAAALAAVTPTGCGGGGDSGDPVAAGAALFRGSGTCATCHGPNLEGTSMGPSLLDPQYREEVFGDEQIRAAIRNGVRTQRLGLGVMPALTHLDDVDIDDLIAFVRSQQHLSEGSAP